MKINEKKMYRLIIKEVFSEYNLSEDKADDLLAYIKGGPKPDWMDDDDREIPKPPKVPASKKQAADDTMPFGPSDIPSDDAPERDVSGFQDRAGPPLEDQIAALVQGMPPEEVADIFQAVFEKLPGVEMQDEEPPETLYTPGAEGRPQAGFKEELIRIIKDELKNLTEAKKKENCFAKGKYETFKGKAKCIRRTKGLDSESANAYVAKVLRDMGEIE